MAKISNVFGTTFSGKIGKKIIASSWKGHEYIRTYVKPHNPNTEDQRRARGLFADAVDAWHDLSSVQREFYDGIAERMSGFNLFVSRHVRAAQRGGEPETPLEMRWKTEDDMPLDDCSLHVTAGKRGLFNVHLDEDGRAEVALTPSDSPYMFLLKRGKEERKVLEVTDLLKEGVPKELKSRKLGIRLVEY